MAPQSGWGRFGLWMLSGFALLIFSLLLNYYVLQDHSTGLVPPSAAQEAVKHPPPKYVTVLGYDCPPTAVELDCAVWAATRSYQLRSTDAQRLELAQPAEPGPFEATAQSLTETTFTYAGVILVVAVVGWVLVGWSRKDRPRHPGVNRPKLAALIALGLIALSVFYPSQVKHYLARPSQVVDDMTAWARKDLLADFTDIYVIDPVSEVIYGNQPSVTSAHSYMAKVLDGKAVPTKEAAPFRDEKQVQGRLTVARGSLLYAKIKSGPSWLLGWIAIGGRYTLAQLMVILLPMLGLYVVVRSGRLRSLIETYFVVLGAALVAFMGGSILLATYDWIAGVWIPTKLALLGWGRWYWASVPLVVVTVPLCVFLVWLGRFVTRLMRYFLSVAPEPVQFAQTLALPPGHYPIYDQGGGQR